ncbi:MAG TPA: M48 family metallopeptidase [Oligoflexus sp.]|uniref:M48 family metallopeptidase n=1 Tax=Oligoflexus sp. TaxID=1971216 RepID=UPI002D7FF86C|nr:M48 family metallopeptidase [Oligoflexus sp.]HET9241126.1 M48 family metallopeptidase [Oligoflexus sp.]
MQQVFSAIFCDGQSPVEESVQASFIQGQWIIQRVNAPSLTWTMAELHWEKQPNAVLYTHRKTDATLLVSGADLANLPGLDALDKVRGSRKNAVIAGLLASVIVLVTLLIMGMRPLSRGIASSISPERERQLFASLLPETFFEKHGCHDMQANEILAELGQKIRPQDANAAPIDFMLLDWDMANAFALPGRKIAVTTGLLRRIHSSEELLAILGHELGHVELRHNLSEFIRASLSGFAWGVLVGDFSGAFVVDPSLMKQAGEMALSREMEEEADHFGAERLVATGYSPKALASALDAITMREDDKEETHAILRFLKPVLDIFSTHPETSKRVASLRESYPQPEGKEALSLQSWNILRTACEKAPAEDDD